MELHRVPAHAAPRRAVSHEAQSADLFRSNLSPFQLLYVTIRAYGRIADRLAGRNSQVRPLPYVCGSFGGSECMVLELVGLSLPHALHDRCRHVKYSRDLR